MIDVPIAERRLGNGLRIVVSEDHAAPVAALNIWYDVGSRHEPPGKTGYAHLFEHLMFEGSRQVAAGEHFRVISTLGGILNATTSTERTNYFETVPVEHLDLALWLEADRMGGLLDALTQECLDNQRDVVKNERRQRYDNVPYGTARERLCELLFPPGHPYHHQTIGSMEDLSAASLADMTAFFTAYYSPDNAVLAVVGDVTPDAVYEAVERYFGGIAPGADAARPSLDASAAPLGPPAAEVRDTCAGAVPADAVYLGYRLPPDTAEPSEALHHLSLAAAVLDEGRASVFDRALLRTELAQSATITFDRRVAGASLAVVEARARRGSRIEDVEVAVRREIDRLAGDGPTEADLARSKALVERGWLDIVADPSRRADQLARFATRFGDPGLVRTWIDPQLEATADDVRRAVADHLVGNPPAVLTFRQASAVAA